MLKKIHITMNKRLFSTLFSLVMILSLVAPQPLIQATHAATGGDTLKANPRRTPPLQAIARQEFPVAPNPDNQQGLQIVLGEGAEQPAAPAQLPVADTTPLDAAQTQQIIDRLPVLEIAPADLQEFRLPVASLPPPRAGETITETFPPQQDEAAAPEVESGPLQVLRYAPEGEIPLAPFLNVTFNQPMAPLTTLQQLAAQDAPVKITPEVPGVWKWLGTRTLSFEYASDEFDRFPMATEFTVEIPAGTESMTGGVLAEAVTWKFRTPAPTVQSYYPNSSPQPRDPLFYVQFDQRIDPAAVLETVSVRAQGQRYPVQLATEDEIAADARVQKLSESAPESRWLAFRSEQQLPADSTVAVDIGPGTPSAEGPLATEKVQSFSFQTYGPLRVIESRCGYGQCPPFAPFIIRFNNPLDQDAFDEAWITIDPALPGAVINNFGDTLQIQGPTQGRTTYKVTLAAELRDIFGQTLEQEQTLEFQVGSAVPMLTGPSDLTITLDPSSAPVFTVYSINYTSLRYRVFAVQPEDWPAYQQYRDNFWRNVTPPDPPGQLLEENFVEIAAKPDELIETPIALGKMLPNGLGHLIVVVDIPLRLNLQGQDTRNQTVQTWVQVTQMGLDAFVDHSEMTAWANDLRTGAPLADVEVSLLNSQAAAVTGEDGTAKLALPSQSSPLLIARKGDDAAILPQSSYSGGGWQAMPVQDELAWYVWDDRQMYRPGEEVHVKGWVRRVGGKQDGDVSLLGGQDALNYIVSDPQGNQLTTGSAELNAAGGFDLAFTLPENANLGYANLQLSLAGSVSNLNSRDYWHSFQIQEFRRPEFEVTAGNESTGPFFVGGEAVTFVRAAYFAGGPLPNAETFWNVSASPTNYTPPNWPGYIFGSWTPWWSYSDFYYGGPGGGSSYVSYNSRTDASGAHYLKMEFTGADEPRPYSVQADVSVMDVNRQSWAASTTLLVHPADIYVGLRSERTFVEQGTPLEVEAVAVDIDGNAVSGRTINMRAARLEWKYKNGQWNEEEADVQECTLTSSAFPAESPTLCTFATEQGGTYRITATVEDEQGRLNQTVLTRWVSGGKRPPARQVEREEATLIPDKEEYQPGDTAEILVQAPFAPAEGLLTVSRNGILYTERFQMESASTIIQVPIEERHIPNLYVQVDLVGAARGWTIRAKSPPICRNARPTPPAASTCPCRH
ncbi:MAG: MG2 domain-containing protein [Caldilineaceae bacterium]